MFWSINPFYLPANTSIAFYAHIVPFIAVQPIICLLVQRQSYSQNLYSYTVNNRNSHHIIFLVYQGTYTCNGCGQSGTRHVWHCGLCDFDLHPMCIQKLYQIVVENQFISSYSCCLLQSSTLLDFTIFFSHII